VGGITWAEVLLVERFICSSSLFVWPYVKLWICVKVVGRSIYAFSLQR